MVELWELVTPAQAIVIVGVLWVLVQAAYAAANIVRRLFKISQPTEWEHAEHCDTADQLDEHLEKLTAYAHDQHNVSDQSFTQLLALVNNSDEHLAELRRIRATMEKLADPANSFGTTGGVRVVKS